MKGFSTASENPALCQPHPGISIPEQLIALANEAFALEALACGFLDRPDGDARPPEAGAYLADTQKAQSGRTVPLFNKPGQKSS
ncbi:MAG: hypothetical protein ABSH38_15420 [Verrucomicrobiota bacterium]|jgi:hypothetical protein